MVTSVEVNLKTGVTALYHFIYLYVLHQPKISDHLFLLDKLIIVKNLLLPISIFFLTFLFFVFKSNFTFLSTLSRRWVSPPKHFWIWNKKKYHYLQLWNIYLIKEIHNNVIITFIYLYVLHQPKISDRLFLLDKLIIVKILLLPISIFFNFFIFCIQK